jgi:cell division septal protein FtsQ
MRRFKGIIFFTFVLLFTFTGIVLSGYWKDRTNTNKVEVTGNVTLSKDEIFDFAMLTDSLILSNSISLQMIESRVSKHPNIKSVNATRENGTIKIDITEKTPFAMVTNGHSVYLVDNALNLYNLKKENTGLDLPVISGMSKDIDIDYLTSTDLRNLKTAQYIIRKSAKIDRVLYNFISEINFSDSAGITLYTTDDTTPVYLVDYSFLDYQVRSSRAGNVVDINDTEFRNTLDKKLLCLVNFLKQVIVYKSRFSFAYVDLRYKDLVVVKNNSISITD